jgi:NADH dehydrogenase [ubiquinone] 1 alpha subcomplex assembly factor 1
VAAPRVLIDFAAPGALDAWGPVDDVVMGGRSRSAIEKCPDGAAFTGLVSLENNGGFASVRTRPGAWDASGATAFVLRARSDGKRYKLTVRTDDGFDGVQYQSTFTTPWGEWHDVRLPVASFAASFRGRRVEGAPPLATGRIRAFGFMISEKQAGSFRLEVATLSAE